MFSRYYHSELAFMREMVREFSQSGDGVPGLIGERGGDPGLEQLLQGFAFLAARIHQRVENEAPEIIHEVCDIVLPQLLRSIPSCSILEFAPDLDSLLSRKLVETNTEITSTPIDGTQCRFRTPYAFDLVPVQIEKIDLDAPGSSAPILRLQMKTSIAGQDAVFHKDGIRFFLNGDYAVATTLWFWFQRYCNQIRIRPIESTDSDSIESMAINDSSNPRNAGVQLPIESLKAVGFERSQALLPWPQRALEGFRLVQEYFTIPQKFLFIDLIDLDAAQSIASTRFEIAFRFNKPPALPGRINQESLRLHCIPAINLFTSNTKPVACGGPDQEHLLQEAELPAEHAEIYSIESVTGRQRQTAPGARYIPFASLERASFPEEDCPYYKIRREISHTEDGLELYISAWAPPHEVPHLETEQLTIPVTCTNRSLAGRLRKGDLCHLSSALKAEVTNILNATKPVLPPIGSDAYWRFVSHISLGHHALQDTQTLQSILHLYNFQTSADQQGVENRKRIEAILSVRAFAKRRVVEASAMRGVAVEMEIQENAFVSTGEIFLFGTILNYLLASRVSFNSFNELTLRLQPSGISFTWPPTVGHQTVF